MRVRRPARKPLPSERSINQQQASGNTHSRASPYVGDHAIRRDPRMSTKINRSRLGDHSGPSPRIARPVHTGWTWSSAVVLLPLLRPILTELLSKGRDLDDQVATAHRRSVFSTRPANVILRLRCMIELLHDGPIFSLHFAF